MAREEPRVLLPVHLSHLVLSLASEQGLQLQSRKRNAVAPTYGARHTVPGTFRRGAGRDCRGPWHQDALMEAERAVYSKVRVGGALGWSDVGIQRREAEKAAAAAVSKAPQVGSTQVVGCAPTAAEAGAPRALRHLLTRVHGQESARSPQAVCCARPERVAPAAQASPEAAGADSSANRRSGAEGVGRKDRQRCGRGPDRRFVGARLPGSVPFPCRDECRNGRRSGVQTGRAR